MRCDAHVHIVGPTDQYPLAPNRPYLPAPAPLSALRENAARRGIGRFVLVQPSFYGADNRLLMHSLLELGGAGRGVAAIDPDTCDLETLNDLARCGVRGLRVNLYTHPHGSGLPAFEEAFQPCADAARGMGWHVEMIAPMAVLARHLDALARASVDIVIDHYALHEGFDPARGEGRAVLSLVGQKNVWVKLSAPYRSGGGDLATRPDRLWLEALLDAAPDRCLWGSDWPFTPDGAHHAGPAAAAAYRALRYEDVYDGFAASMPSGEGLRRVTEDNPARLYGFDGPAVSQGA